MADVSQLSLNGVTYTLKDSVARAAAGGPNVAATKSAMSDTSKVYVYTGSESGMTAGNWYYYKNSNWVSGGVYQSTGVETDKALVRLNGAADANIVGNAFSKINTELGESYHDYIRVGNPVSVAVGYINSAEIGSVFTANATSTGKRGYISVKPGDKYSVDSYATSGVISAGVYALVATDSANIVYAAVQYSGSSGGIQTNEITIPGGANRLWVCGYYASEEAFLTNVLISKAEFYTLAEQKENLGECYIDGSEIDLSSNVVTGFIPSSDKFKTGDTLTFSSSANYSYSYAPVNSGKSYKVTLIESSNYARHWLFFTNNNLVIRQALWLGSQPLTSLPKTGYVTAPDASTRLYIVSFYGTSQAYLKNVRLLNATKVSAATAITKIKKENNVQHYKIINTVDLSAHTLPNKIPSVDDVCQTLEFNDHTNYSAAFINGVRPGEYYKVTVNEASNYGKYWVYFTSDSDDPKVIERVFEPSGKGGERSEVVLVPSGASRMYIVSYTNTEKNYLRHTYCELIELVDAIETNKLISSPVNAADNLPPYYTNEWISSRINQINSNTKIRHGISFGFITDVHMQANQMNSRFLARHVLDETTIPFIVFGGDVVRAYGSRDDLFNDAEQWRSWVNYVKDVIQIRGNHDYTIKTSSEIEEGYTEDNNYVYDYLMRAQEWKVEEIHTTGMYFMLDNKAQRIRMLFLDQYENPNPGPQPWSNGVYVSQTQYDWIIEKITEVTNYTFIVFTHMCPDESGNIYASGGWAGLIKLEKALNNRTSVTYENSSTGVHFTVDFTNSTNYLACNISGHNHRDASNTDSNVLSITTTCDASYDLENRSTLTPDEQAIDVFTIDTDSRTIKTVRVGGGDNRSWTY